MLVFIYNIKFLSGIIILLYAHSFAHVLGIFLNYTRIIPALYARYTHVIHTLYTHGIYTRYMHTLYTHVIYTHVLYTHCTPIVRT